MKEECQRQSSLESQLYKVPSALNSSVGLERDPGLPETGNYRWNIN